MTHQRKEPVMGIIVGPHAVLEELRAIAKRLKGSFHVDVEHGEVSYWFVRGAEMTDFSALTQARKYLIAIAKAEGKAPDA